MAENKDEAPKIFVDSDWKEEARREKEELDRQAREQEATDEIPPASVLDIAQMIVMQATIALGAYQDPQTGQRIPANLPAARHYIDLLALLDEKTANNITAEEHQILQATTHQLRMAFVEIAGGRLSPEGGPQGDSAQK